MSLRLVPFVFGHGPWLSSFSARVSAMDDCDDVRALDVLDPARVGFFRLMLAANARAFGDLGMPAWVQLDCATLPTAMIGFAARAADLDAGLCGDLAARAGLDAADVSGEALVPVAEYTALCTPEPGRVVGFSLFSLVPGLGLRAKAMALRAMGARRQTGITQRDNSALKTHARLGPLTVVQVGVAAHSRPQTTLVYELAVPDDAALIELARGALTRVPIEGPTTERATSALAAGDVLVDVDVGRGVAVLAG